MYEILDDYHLLDEEKAGERIANLEKDSIMDLFSEIERYYERNLKRIVSEFQDPEDMNVVHYPNLDFSNFSKRICLYVDKIIVNDSIYDLLSATEKGFKIDFVKRELDRELKSFIELKELVDNEILFFAPFKKILFPASKVIKEAAEQDCANPDYRKICGRNMIVGLDKNETEDLSYSFTFTQLGLNVPCKFTAGLQFKQKKAGAGSLGLEMTAGKPFMLNYSGKTIELKPSRVPRSVFEKDKQTKKEVDHILLWQAEEIISSIYLNDLFKAHPITDFDVMWKLMNWKFGNIEAKDKTIPTLLEIDLKFLKDLKIKDILKIRKKEDSIFKDFRNTFNTYCKEIMSIPGTENFEKEVRQLKREKIDPQLRKLDREFKRIKNFRFIRSAVIGICSLSGAAFGQIGITLATGGAALLREYGEYYKETRKMKENPLFFLWKLKTR